MSLLDTFRSWPTGQFKPDTLRRWMSGLKSRLPSGSTSRRSPELVPALAAIVLLLAAGVQFAMPATLDLPNVPRTKPASVQDAASVAPQAYQAVLAHPIFAPDRAPPPAEAASAGNLNGVEVLGTAIAGNRMAALVRESDGTFARVKVGDEIEGWKLLSIAPQELVFDRNGEHRSLSVDVDKLKAQARSNPGLKAGQQAPVSEPDDDEEDDSDE